MSESSKGRRRPRAKQTYQHHKNAVCVTVYDPNGETIPVEVREKIEQSVFDVALANKLFISIAYE